MKLKQFSRKCGEISLRVFVDSKIYDINGIGFVGQIIVFVIVGYRVIVLDLRGMGQIFSLYGMYLLRVKFCLIQKCFKFDFFCLCYLLKLIVLDQIISFFIRFIMIMIQE